MAICKRTGSAKGTLYLYKRVPKRFASVEPRRFIWLSLHTDSLSMARTKEAATWDQMLAAWEAKLAGDSPDAERRFAAAQELAEARGFRYLRADEVARLPLADLRDRFAAIPGFQDHPEAPDMMEAGALLGAAQEPPLTVSRCLELYWSLAKDRTLGKSEDQVRRWRNPRKKAVKNFIDVVGDRAIGEITADDMLDFRDWWLDKVRDEELSTDSANKDLIHLGDVLRTVNRMKRLNLILPLSDLTFKKGEAKTRPPFTVKWIETRLLEANALKGLNSEARAMLLAMVNTGCRPSELAALTRNTIRLEHDVPHISIEPEGRELKSLYARRKISLLGVSLDSLKSFPEGFPRYRDSSASLSATVNKFLRENGLMETPAHVLYSLRHSFEDRMLGAGVDDRIRRDLFGHRLTRERYGDGASLEQKRTLLQAIAL